MHYIIMYFKKVGFLKQIPGGNTLELSSILKLQKLRENQTPQHEF